MVILGEGRWHAVSLAAALARRGLSSRRLAFVHLAFDPAAPGGLRCGPLARPPRAVVVRAIAAGSFEQVTLRLGLLRALALSGIPVINPARAIEACVDKSEASFRLRLAGIPTPAVWVTEDPARAREIVLAEASPARPLVAKPLFGAQGRGIVRVTGPHELPPAEAVAGVWYLQRLVDRPEPCDYRVFVVDGEPVAAMCRRGRDWITNVRRGARGEPWRPDAEAAELAVRAAAVLGTVFCGVDLVRDREGRTWVLEVNSMPAWRELVRASGVDVADRIARAVAERLA